MKTSLEVQIIAMALLLGFDAASSDRFSRQQGGALNEWVVADHLTGLMWQGCPASLKGARCDEEIENTYTWEEALDYCETLEFGGHGDWRLPSRAELTTIQDDRLVFPCIDEEVFPATPGEWFWTSTTFFRDNDEAWVVGFNGGLMTYYSKLNPYNVRCVRNGQ